MRFTIFYSVVVLVIFWRYIVPLRITRVTKAGLFVLFALVPLIQAWIVSQGGLASPEVPRWLLIAQGWAAFTLVAIALLLILRDVFVFLCVLAGRKGERTKDVLQHDRRLALGMAIASGGLSAVGLNEGIAVADVVRRDMPIKDLPKDLEGLTLLQLSDLHASSLLREPHMAALVERANALKPDIVLVTGDVADGTVVRRDKDVEPLTKLTSRYGVFVCEGNHEHYSDYDHWVEKFPQMGWIYLKNAAKVLTIGNAQLTIGGVADPMAERFGRELPDIQKTFAGTPESAPRILLAHQPKLARRYREKVRFDVQLSGHTHGGHMWGMNEAVAMMNGGFVYGWYAIAPDTRLYVHSGSGLWNGFPIRLGVPSEMVLFTLKRA